MSRSLGLMYPYTLDGLDVMYLYTTKLQQCERSSRSRLQRRSQFEKAVLNQHLRTMCTLQKRCWMQDGAYVFSKLRCSERAKTSSSLLAMSARRTHLVCRGNLVQK